MNVTWKIALSLIFLASTQNLLASDASILAAMVDRDKSTNEETCPTDPYCEGVRVTTLERGLGEIHMVRENGTYSIKDLDRDHNEKGHSIYRAFKSELSISENGCLRDGRFCVGDVVIAPEGGLKFEFHEYGAFCQYEYEIVGLVDPYNVIVEAETILQSYSSTGSICDGIPTKTKYQRSQIGINNLEILEHASEGWMSWGYGDNIYFSED